MDSGGTTTSTYALDEQGTILNKHASGIGSPAVSKDATKSIEEAIEAVYQKMQNHELRGLCLGISGIGAIENLARFTNDLKAKYKVKVIIVSDAAIALRSIADDEGIILVAGTGNACLGYQNGSYHLTGGGGPLLDERGSAYSFMQRSIMKMKERFEKGLPYSNLDQFIFTKMNLYSFPEIKTYFYNHTKADIANFTEKVLSEKIQDQALLTEIKALIKEQAQELAMQVKLQYCFFKFKNKPILGLLGGFLEHNELLQCELTKILKNEGYNLEIINKVDKAYLGALKIIKEEKDE